MASILSMGSVSTTRADKALATRRRMVNAAYDQFCANGYLGTTITAVATDAGVAVPTIYYTFGTKARLLDEALGAAIVGFDRWHEPPPDPSIEELLPWHRWWTDLNAAPTSAEAFGIFLTHGVAILERVAPLVAALHGAAGDPEAADVARMAEQRRIESYREAAQVIAAKQGGLRDGLTVKAATDVLVVLFSAELYRSIRHGRGWSATRTAHFLWDLLSAQLLGSAVPGS
jgi:AcrR family transcriptional regulator